MEVFRLSRKKYSTILSGQGAALKGARWNSKGYELIYSAANRSLAMAKVAVHFSYSTLPSDFMMITIQIPNGTSIKSIPKTILPVNWNSFPYINETQSFGNNFIKENKFCLLKVPSAVTKGDFNILINPYHREFSNIKIISAEPFPFDKRIFK